MVLCCGDSIFRNSPLHCMGSILRRLFGPKFPLFEGCYVPKILFSEHRPQYTDSVLRSFFNRKIRKLYIACSHHNPNDYLSISVIRLQWVCPSKSSVMWGRTPTLWMEAHIFVNRGWKSVKLNYEQKAVKLLICGNFLNEICDILDIKHIF